MDAYDWSVLPDDIIRVIARKLDAIEGFIRCSAVCHSWNKTFSITKLNWNANTPAMPPWLLFPDANEPSTEDSRIHKGKGKKKKKKQPQPQPQPSIIPLGRRKIFDILNKKTYKFYLPQMNGRKCIGSGHGWILMLGCDRKIYLLNPITKSQLSLPDLKRTQDEVGFRDDLFPEIILKYRVQRAAVLKIPREDHTFEFVVMLIHFTSNSLLFARPGDQAWSEVLRNTKKRRHQDVFCWNGLVLILYNDGVLRALKYNDLLRKEIVSLEPKDYMPTIHEIIYKEILCIGEVYLLELNGELLMVLRLKKDIDTRDYSYRVTYKTIGFRVYQLNCDDKVWEKVESLGDYMLFVGYNPAMAVHKSKAPNLQSNAIYYTDDEVLYMFQDTYGHDMAVYDYASNKIRRFYKGHDAATSNYFAPTWFVPEF